MTANLALLACQTEVVADVKIGAPLLWIAKTLTVDVRIVLSADAGHLFEDILQHFGLLVDRASYLGSSAEVVPPQCKNFPVRNSWTLLVPEVSRTPSQFAVSSLCIILHL